MPIAFEFFKTSTPPVTKMRQQLSQAGVIKMTVQIVLYIDFLK